MTPTPDWLLALLDLGRLLLAAVALYGLASCIFPLRATGWTQGEARWARAVLMTALCTGLVLGTALLGLYDGLLFISVLLLTAAASLRWRHRAALVTHLYARLLAWADRRDRLRAVRTRLRRTLRFWSVDALLLGLVLVGSAGVRLVPLLSTPALLSLQHYRLLELAKHLQANNPVPGGLLETRVPHALAVALHAFTEVPLSVVLHLLGGLVGLSIVVSLYVLALYLSGNRGAALTAAGVWGLGLPVLPWAVENQVEFSPLLLAVAFALPAWYFLLRYLDEGGRLHLGVGTVALGLVLLTKGSVAVLTLALMGGTCALHLMGSREWASRKRALWGQCSVLGAAGTLAGLVGLRRWGSTLDPYAVPSFSVGGVGVLPQAPDFSPAVYGLVIGVVVLVLCAAVLNGFRRTRRLDHTALAMSCVGFFGLWLPLHAHPQPVLDPYAALALGSALLAVVLGSTVAIGRSILHILRPGGRRPLRLRPLYNGAVPLVLVVGLAVSPPPLLPAPTPDIEPPGYSRALHQIQRALKPYEWTAVSHRGTAVLTMNEGRFLEYEYFLQHYDPTTYQPDGTEAIPTPSVFLFVPRTPGTPGLRSELLSTDRALVPALRHWVATYRRQGHPLSVAYSDDALTVYHLAQPSKTPEQMIPLLSRRPR